VSSGRHSRNRESTTSMMREGVVHEARSDLSFEAQLNKRTNESSWKRMIAHGGGTVNDVAPRAPTAAVGGVG
jgi:hypothetical protein